MCCVTIHLAHGSYEAEINVTTFTVYAYPFMSHFSFLDVFFYTKSPVLRIDP